jgi:hypothetical protein
MLVGIIHAHGPEIGKDWPGCSDNFQDCHSSMCCSSNKGFACYEKGPLFALCLPVGKCRDHWPAELIAGTPNPSPEMATCNVLEVHTTTHLPPVLLPTAPRFNSRHHVPVQRPYVAPPTPPTIYKGSGVCGANFNSCFDSHCCISAKTFACYEKGPHYASCLPIGKCRQNWKTMDDGTCTLLEVKCAWVLACLSRLSLSSAIAPTSFNLQPPPTRPNTREQTSPKLPSSPQPSHMLTDATWLLRMHSCRSRLLRRTLHLHQGVLGARKRW